MVSLPLIVDGVSFIILNRKTVIAVDAETGKLIWSAEHPGADNDANSVQSGGNLPITGELVHTHSVNYWGGRLWFTDFGCTLTGLDAKTGERVKDFENLCLERPLDLNDKVGYGLPGNSGLYGSLQPHAPVKYEKGNFGYGDAKKELFELICEKYKKERENFNQLMDNTDIIEKELQKGAKKARVIASEVLQRVRTNIGY